MSLSTTTSGGVGTSDVISTSIGEDEGQTVRGPCGGVMWILCRLAGGSTGTPNTMFVYRSLPNWRVEFLEVNYDLGLEGNQNKLGPLEDSLEVATPMGWVSQHSSLPWKWLRPYSNKLPSNFLYYMGWLTNQFLRPKWPRHTPFGTTTLAYAHNQTPLVLLIYTPKPPCTSLQKSFGSPPSITHIVV